MRIDILTLFPEAIEPFVAASIVGRAVQAGLVTIRCWNFREFAKGNHRSVDDRPFGGGPGMLLMCEPIFDAVEAIERDASEQPTRIMLTPSGERFNQRMAESLAGESRLTILCGHYEGFDERIPQGLNAREVSIGDFVLSGGESAAMVLVDAIVRLLPGALGDETAAMNDSFTDDRLEYPQYTRPREFRGMKVPDVLLSGDHEKIAEWRTEQSKDRTRRRRPDLGESSEPRASDDRTEE